MRSSMPLLVCFLGLATACSSADTKETVPPGDTGCKADSDCAGTPDTPLCDAEAKSCVALPLGYQIGYRDGTPASVIFTVIYEPDKQRSPTDLAFNPSKPEELWVVNQGDDSVIVMQKPGEPDVTSKRYHDPDAKHFMDRPPAISFGAMSENWGQTFGVCGDSDNGGNYFMGPALFSADLSIFAKPTPDGLGSHIDMLHSTSFCRGIAHVDANVYWTFNSQKKSLDKYDFHEDHGPGNDDHSDGEIYRYVKTQVLGVDDVPSHLFFEPSDQMLYVADTGNKRIAKLDTTTGTVGSSFSGDEQIKARKYVNDAVLVDVVPPGTLEAPSGIEIEGEVLFVSDNATSKFYAFRRDTGELLRSLDTGMPPGSLAGFTISPNDGKVYFVNMNDSRVYRIDPM